MAKPSVARRIQRRAGALPRSVHEVARFTEVVAELRSAGWCHNLAPGRSPRGPSGESIPWMTYAAIAFLDRVLGPEHRLFEYGSGGSTSWWAARAGEIRSVEHDPTWFSLLAQPANGSIDLVQCPSDWWSATGDEASTYVQSIADRAPWDVVVVDGVARNQSTRAAIEHVTDDGMIVVDDTDIEAVIPSLAALDDAGFGRIDFPGLRPGIAVLTSTSIFSRDLTGWARRAADDRPAIGRNLLPPAPTAT